MNDKTRKQLLKLVNDNYQAIAQSFSGTRQQPLWPEAVKLIKAKLPPETTAKLIDVGCGNGRLLNELPDNVEYLGVDSSQKLIDLAAAEPRRHRQVNFMVGDILKLNLIADHDFDVATAIAVIHHLPSAAYRLEALKQLKSKLRPGGYLIVTAWNLWSRPRFHKLIWKFWLLTLFKKQQLDFGDILFNWQNRPEPEYRRYYHALTAGQLKKLVKAAGLNLISLSKDKDNYYVVAQKNQPS